MVTFNAILIPHLFYVEGLICVIAPILYFLLFSGYTIQLSVPNFKFRTDVYMKKTIVNRFYGGQVTATTKYVAFLTTITKKP